MLQDSCVSWPHHLLRPSPPEQILLQVSPSIVVVDISDIYGKSIEKRSGIVIDIGQVVTSCHAIQKDRN
jgi:hypothetical protein